MLRLIVTTLMLCCLLACDSKTPQSDPVLPEPPCGTQNGMVGIKRLDTGACFWMDARPVSRGEFFGAVEAGMPFSADGACAEHDTHAPVLNRDRSGFCHGETNLTDLEILEGRQYMGWPPGGNTRHLPMQCASWCDARAYCSFVGKRLCQAADTDQFSSAAAQEDEIHAACTTGRSPIELPEANCACLDEGLNDCDKTVSPWECALRQCEGPLLGMQCMVKSPIYVQSDQPAVQSMGWRGSGLDCSLGSIAISDAPQRAIDSANIVCCSD